MIIARRTARQSVETQAASPMITRLIRSVRKKLRPLPEYCAPDTSSAPKLRASAPMTWSIGVPSCVPDVK